MKPRIYIYKALLLSVVLICCCRIELFSQREQSGDWKQPGIFFGVNAGVANPYIINEVSQGITVVQNNRGSSFIGSIDIGYFFSRYFGLTAGIKYSQYYSNLYIDSYQNHLNTVDIENDPYELRITGNDVEEIQQFDIMSIPFYVNVRLPLNKEFGAFLQTGINFFVPLSKSYESVGTFTYQGYFPAYNVVLEDMPEYGFPSDLRIQSKGIPELYHLSIGCVASLGLDYLVNKRVQLMAAVYFDRSLSELLENSSTGEFYLTTSPENINSILGSANNVTLQSFGLRIGVRYYLTDYNKFKYYSHPSIKRNIREYERQRNRLGGK